jgi:hypothetical protein
VTLPLLALIAGTTDTRPAAPLLAALRPWCRTLASDPGLGRPDAYLSLAVDGAPLEAALRSPDPVAVVVDSFGRIPADVRNRADVFITRDEHTTEQLGDRAVLIPLDALPASAHPPLTPFVRSRWRERLHLPETMLLRLGVAEPWTGPPHAVIAALAVCSAAVVHGPRLLTALALGTPTVTDDANATRVGAVSNVHAVVGTPFDSDRLAEDLADEPRRATAIGWGGRLLVEARHDLDAMARTVLERLGIGPAPFPVAPLATLDEELAALGTPATSSVALRALRRASTIAGPEDWASLTGRRR